jgi:glycosyltransferase involved in cell wall biosynthesis
VQPSIVEGFCLAVAEALAAGMVVAATDTGGIRDYGIDRSNMFIIKGFSRDKIADVLRQAMESYSTIVETMSAAAIETAQKKFNEDAVRRLWALARAMLMTIRFSRPMK